MRYCSGAGARCPDPDDPETHWGGHRGQDVPDMWQATTMRQRTSTSLKYRSKKFRTPASFR